MNAPVTAATVPATAISRVNFAFSADGRSATCLRVVDDDCRLESWTFRFGSTEHRIVSAVPMDPAASALPLGDGRVLLYPNGGPLHEVSLLRTGSRYRAARRLGTVRGLGGYLLPSPNPAELGYVVVREDPHRTMIWRIGRETPAMSPVLQLPGAAADGMWVDGRAGLLALNLARHGGHTDGVLVDVRGQSWKPLFSVSEDSNDRIVAYGPASRLLVVSSSVTGQDRLGWVRLGDGAVRFPDRLHRDGYPRQALAVDPGGDRLLLHEQDGARSALLTYRVESDEIERLAVPTGTMSPPACWSAAAIRLPFSAPACPPTVLSLSPHGGAFSITSPLRTSRTWADAESVELAGEDGAVDAIVYGSRGWRSAEHLVLALHGGPLASWRLEFTPLFQDLAAAGVAVCAPNYRGSVGYGTAHARAVVGAWGGPDLADVLRLSGDLAKYRADRGLPPPVLVGVSYGAFLALLAAAAAPESCSGCVALAPFLSGRRLHADAEPWVADRIARLGALDAVADDLGHRDVLDMASRIDVPLLVVHGTEDDVIPVRQSRTLCRHLRALGRREGRDFHYREVPGGHHELAGTPPAALRELVVTFSRTRGCP